MQQCLPSGFLLANCPTKNFVCKQLEELCLLECDAVSLGEYFPTFRRHHDPSERRGRQISTIPPWERAVLARVTRVVKAPDCLITETYFSLREAISFCVLVLIFSTSKLICQAFTCNTFRATIYSSGYSISYNGGGGGEGENYCKSEVNQNTPRIKISSWNDKNFKILFTKKCTLF
jgi:hypothetical protein